MTNINVSILGVPRIPRNKRIYAGGYKVENYTIGESSEITDTIIHVETGILEYDNGDFLTREVTITFRSPFIIIPYGGVRVYRYEAREGGTGYFESDVVYYVADSAWKSEEGFTITIEDYEALAGVVVEYFFTEQN